MSEKTYDLQERLIDFAVDIITIVEKTKKSISLSHLKRQIIRSSTSTAANYGEAQAAESKADFIHKMKLVLKELRETHVWLLILIRSQLVNDIEKLNVMVVENNELIAIVFSSIRTAIKNQES